MKNVLSCVQGDSLSFSLYHEVDGEQYELAEDELYRMKIKKSLSSKEPDKVIDCYSNKIEFYADLDCGKYYFEIDLVSVRNGTETESVILPATDNDGARISTLCVTERL